ncbi:hypothetical protein GEOBRER4_n1400 [Citrifermentans bremense]|uniref:Uncharacterized protein n=1 Tax=Citrifermentans bremense TaxID=60035 RepID=A0A7R7J045_9BACT|nr:hypothetical protein GEOBRER4_n1400 [Citrifermentans bremense]
MKRLLVVAMAVGLFGAMPAFAVDHSSMKMDTKEGVRDVLFRLNQFKIRSTG